ncbi:hypothetical protein SODALDRAFT_377226 [Sodiomyces alkalinus F11]|uniref:Transcription factor domain-containing protein n=1 Tax=Sodiomyces alkalinus (strain CBS 110278 / VKM F-3762 / F11) TaxID=1314773 RepID=A0A3N2Q4E0_SODAK|nr:hypothetical protein SODALDRAFT_377226 [Sodiomyces alkalinus F11]ROT41567.1 hypothetical protein SODALDRAFT_377226 [Sodiomyces alkalinus F11]
MFAKHVLCIAAHEVPAAVRNIPQSPLISFLHPISHSLQDVRYNVRQTPGHACQPSRPMTAIKSYIFAGWKIGLRRDLDWNCSHKFDPGRDAAVVRQRRRAWAQLNEETRTHPLKISHRRPSNPVTDDAALGTFDAFATRDPFRMSYPTVWQLGDATPQTLISANHESNVRRPRIWGCLHSYTTYNVLNNKSIASARFRPMLCLVPISEQTRPCLHTAASDMHFGLDLSPRSRERKTFLGVYLPNRTAEYDATEKVPQEVESWVSEMQDSEDQEDHQCGNCVKHGVPCDFEAPSLVIPVDDPPSAQTPVPSLAALSPISSVTTPTLSTAVSAASPFLHPVSDIKTPTPIHASPAVFAAAPLLRAPASAPIRGSTSPHNRLLELRLIHQYTSMTSRTLVVNSPITDDIWQNTVPRLAFEGDGASYLADAMLAVAALHLRALHPGDKDLVRASHAYMASSLSEYCASLNKGISQNNAESLFLTATLIAFQSSASRIFIRDEADPNDPTSVYSLPLSWFHAFQGVKTVVASSWPWLRTSNIVIPIIDSQPVLQLDLDACGATSFFGHLLEGLDAELSDEPEEEADPVVAAATRQSYLHAVAVLNWAHKLPHRGAALAFPATVSKRFLDLLEARRPRALAVLACFFALLKSLESVWWLHGASRREVMGIVSQFEATSPWWSHLEWPVRIALYDGAVIPPDVWGADWVSEESRNDKSATMMNETFVSHIEILSGLLARAQALPPVPIPADALPDRNRIIKSIGVWKSMLANTRPHHMV